MAEDLGGGLATAAEIEENEMLLTTTDVESLKMAWRNEKAASEILQFQAQLVKRTGEQVQLMEETVEEFEESGLDPLTVSLYQMDLDRAQFLLTSYLRVRLQKPIAGVLMIWKKHLEETVLSKLPDNYQSATWQSIISKEDDMVSEPQLDTFVACRTINNFVSLSLADSESPLEMERHDVSFVLYKVIEDKIGADIDLV